METVSINKHVEGRKICIFKYTFEEEKDTYLSIDTLLPEKYGTAPQDSLLYFPNPQACPPALAAKSGTLMKVD